MLLRSRCSAMIECFDTAGIVMADSKISRRVVMGAGAMLGTSPLLLLGCGGGGGGAEPAGVPAPAPAPAPAPNPATPAPAPTPGTGGSVVTGAARDQQTYLFQSVATAAYTSTLGGGSFNTDGWGPTAAYVDFYSGWAWRNRGGGWVPPTK